MRAALVCLVAACAGSPSPSPAPVVAPARAAPASAPASAPANWCIQQLTDPDGGVVFATVDLSLRRDPRKASYPVAVLVQIQIEGQNANGLPTDDEAVALNQVEDRITARLLGLDAGIFVGRTTKRGIRALLYYVGDAAKANATLDPFVKQPQGREWEYAIGNDPAWSAAAPYLADDARCM